MIKLVKSLVPVAQLMRLHQPVGIFLVLWPTLTALWLASDGLPSFELIVIFSAGSFLMRSAGCVINDLTDRKFDRLVQRTKNRPLAAQAISVPAALGVAMLLLCFSATLLMWLPVQTRWWALGAVGLTIIYPWMKRFIYSPQCILGLAFSWAAPMAYSAVNGSFETTTWLWMGIMILWPIAYDTLYARMDAEDDVKVGVLSTARRWNKCVPEMVLFIHACAWCGLAGLGWLEGFNALWGLWLLGAALHVYIQHRSAKTEDRNLWFQAFLSNQWLLGFIFIGVVLQTSPFRELFIYYLG